MKMFHMKNYEITYAIGEEIKTILINTEYSRNLAAYTLGDKNTTEAWKRDGEFFNREGGVCNNISYRLYKPNPEVKIPIKYFTQQYTIADLNRTIDIFLTKAVSANFVIDKDGQVYQFVDPHYRAYALGLGNLSYPSKLNPDIEEKIIKNNLNSYAIAITNINDGRSCFPDVQIESNIALMSALCSSGNFPDLVPSLMIGQNDWTPGRMTGPGPYFDWKKFAEKGFGVFPKGVFPQDDTKILLSWNNPNFVETAWANVEKLKNYGYDIPQDNVIKKQMTDAVGKSLLAFRLHFSGDEILKDPQQKAWWDNYVLLTGIQSTCKGGQYDPGTLLSSLDEKTRADLSIEIWSPTPKKGDETPGSTQANATEKVYQQYLKNLAIFTERDAAKLDALFIQDFSKKIIENVPRYEDEACIIAQAANINDYCLHDESLPEDQLAGIPLDSPTTSVVIVEPAL